MIDTILLVASIVTALTVIIGTCIKVIRTVNTMLREARDDKEFADFCRLWTLRLAIINDSFPDGERLEALRQYEEHGGNGYMHEYGDQLRNEVSAKIHSKVTGAKR